MQRAQFLVEEVSGRLCLFLDRWLRESNGKISTSDRDSLLIVLEQLGTLRKRQVIAEKFKIQHLLQIVNLLESFVQVSSQGVDFIGRVQNELIEWNQSHFDYQEKMTFAGYTFDLVDCVSPENLDRISIRSEQKQLRNVPAQYSSGDLRTFPGWMIRDGEVEVMLKLKRIDRPVVLLFRHYVRRPGLVLQFDWNGKRIQAEEFNDGECSNHFVNRAIVLPAELLVQDENRLIIKTNSAAHEFGFFGVTAYQPTLSGLSE
jgi:hypothetical protein